MFSKKGFTLIELMIVIAVIAILATMVLFGLGRTQAAARDVQRNQIINSVQLALERRYADVSPNAYPATGWVAAVGTSLSTYISGALTDPGCGATCTTCDLKANAAPCGTVSYTFTNPGTVGGKCDGSGYQIVLAKESGGTATFCGPK